MGLIASAGALGILVAVGAPPIAIAIASASVMYCTAGYLDRLFYGP